MKTQIVYVLISRDSDLYLEELWVSLHSLRQFHPEERVIVLTDEITNTRIQKQPLLVQIITEIKVIDVPADYSTKDRSREIKTSVRNLIDGDFLFIDTDTVITKPLDNVDELPVKNIAMVPELHGPFRNHMTYRYVSGDVKRIFGTDVTDSPYWFNSGCMLVKNNEFMREFFTQWHKNWEYSAFQKGNSTDQRALLKTDHDYGYVIECLPDTYNCQMAMSIKHLYEASIVHFWHMRKNFTPVMDFSPFMSHQIYKDLRASGCITPEISQTITDCKSAFTNDSMICGKPEISLIFSQINTVLWKEYKKKGLTKWLVDKLIFCINTKNRIERKFSKNK